jgi:hypothetical protein
LEYVRKITSDDFIIITNRLCTNFRISYHKDKDLSRVESFTIPSRIGKIKVMLLNGGTLIIRGEKETPEFRYVIETVIDVLDNSY